MKEELGNGDDLLQRIYLALGSRTGAQSTRFINPVEKNLATIRGTGERAFVKYTSANSFQHTGIVWNVAYGKITRLCPYNFSSELVCIPTSQYVSTQELREKLEMRDKKNVIVMASDYKLCFYDNALLYLPEVFGPTRVFQHETGIEFLLEDASKLAESIENELKKKASTTFAITHADSIFPAQKSLKKQDRK